MSTEKKSRVMDETKLKQLALARQKANEVRKAGKELKEKEKALKVIEKQNRVEEVETKIKALAKPPPPPPPPPIKTKKPKKIVYVEESSSSSSEDEPEVVYVKKKKRPEVSVAEKESTLTQEPDLEHQMSQAQVRLEMMKIRREMLRKSMFRAF